MNDPASSEGLDMGRIIAEHGEWTAMAIHLGNGLYTRKPAPDWRLRRIVQVVTDLLGKPISEARVLDLACLEGHYGIEFALHGSSVVGMEIREANLVKARYAQQALGLKNISFIQEDVRNLSRAKHGAFDVVICSGILYHLDVPDVFEFVRRIHEVCDRLVVIDTQISLSADVTVEHGGRSYSGLWYKEHDERADEKTKYMDYWASIDNTRSFWLSQPSLCNLIADIGFTSFLRVENPVMPATAEDRMTYVGVKGTPVAIQSSPPTAELAEARHLERNETPPNPIQYRRGLVFRFFKAALPQAVKDVVKKGLRAVRLMQPDATPEFSKRNRPHQRDRS